MAVFSTQLGASVAKPLLGEIGPLGAVAMRIGFATALLWVFGKNRRLKYPASAYWSALWYGLALTGMNVCFYLALRYIPLGVAVTIEFIGPLGIALAASRRVLDIIWALTALCGVLLFAPWTGIHYSPVGLLFAVLSGVGWALYILTTARVGQQMEGVLGLTLGMSVGSVIVVPAGILESGRHLLAPGILLQGITIAALSSALPYGLELIALRRLNTRIFGLLMSTEPAIAALSGFVFLGERLNAQGILAILLVTTATVACRIRA